MDRKAHIKAHKRLHESLDELLADFLRHTKKSLRNITLMEFLAWSHQQTINPTEEEVDNGG